MKLSTEFLRYVLAGLINSAVGYLAFFIAFRFVGIRDFWSNLLSYAVGLLSAYTLNILFVFRKKKRSRFALLIFITGFLFSYGVNLGIFTILKNVTNMPSEVIQIFAMAGYTVAFYLINKYFVFRSGNI